MSAVRLLRRKRLSRAAPGSAKAADAIDMAVGRNVRIRRMAKGLSQTQLGERIGVTFQQVQKYEKGMNRIGAGRLARIAQVLSVPLGLLLGEPEVEEGASLSLIADSRALRLAQAFATIEDPATRLSLVQLVEELARRMT